MIWYDYNMQGDRRRHHYYHHPRNNMLLDMSKRLAVSCHQQKSPAAADTLTWDWTWEDWRKRTDDKVVIFFDNMFWRDTRANVTKIFWWPAHRISRHSLRMACHREKKVSKVKRYHAACVMFSNSIIFWRAEQSRDGGGHVFCQIVFCSLSFH